MPEPSHILIVDDNDDGRSLMKELLEEGGFVVSEANDGGVALDLLTSGPEPALVILDLEMPVMTGAELLQAMKKHERLSNLPVMIVSGSAKSVVPKDSAVVGVFCKPLLGDELVASVRAFVGRRRAG